MPASTTNASRASLAAACLDLARPRQWTKNLWLVAALVFSGEFLHTAACLRFLLGLAAFIFLSSSVYSFNDALDAQSDRTHPSKRHRPVASGRISVFQASVFSGLLALAGLGLGNCLGSAFLAAGAIYLAANLAYSLWAKHQVILDVFFLALFFVLRAVAGGLAINVPISDWLLICASLLALFLGLAKRRGELMLLKAEARAHRPSLAEYSVELLDQMISVVAASTLLAYALYTVGAHTYRGAHPLMLTIPFVLYGIFRYLYLIHQKGLGGSPELVLLKDQGMLVDVGLWIAVSGALLAVEKIYP